MSLRLIILSVSIVGLSACATVDLSSMANNPTNIVRPSIQKNVVERSVSRLQTAFAKKKLSERGSTNRMVAAAQILLKGMDKVKGESSVSDVAYRDSVSDKATVKADLQFASGLVTQTTKAAEVYLDTASMDMTVKKELQNLERALLISNEASGRFVLAMEKVGLAKEDVDWETYMASKESLRLVTDKFGERVRGSLVSASASAS